MDADERKRETVPAEGEWMYMWHWSQKDERRRDAVTNYETFTAVTKQKASARTRNTIKLSPIGLARGR
jgi:hypothetical protein